MNYNYDRSDAHGVVLIDTSKRFDGDCIKKNTIKYLELVERFGWDNFELVTMATTLDKSQGFIKESIAINGEEAYFKNYQFHLVIRNKKQNKMIDVSNGRLMIKSWERYFAEYKQANNPKGDKVAKAFGLLNDKYVAEKGVEFGVTKESAIRAYINMEWLKFDREGLPY